MKKQLNKLMVVPLIIIFLLFMGFKSESAFGQDWSSWSQFKMSECYEGISYRYRERAGTSDKNQVQLEIKNSYTKGISISFFISNNPNDRMIYRTDVASRDTYVTEQYINKGVPFYFLHDKMRFDGDNYIGPYRECDR